MLFAVTTEGQGFLFSRPVPADELTALLWESANSFA